MLTPKQIQDRRDERDKIAKTIRTLKRRSWVLAQEILNGRVFVERDAGQLSLLETAQARTGALFEDVPPAPAPTVPAPTPAATPAPAPKKRGRPRKDASKARPPGAVTASPSFRPDRLVAPPALVEEIPERRIGPKKIPTLPESMIAHLAELGQTFTKPEAKGASLVEVADAMKLDTDSIEGRADVARMLHQAGAIEHEGRWYHPRHLPEGAPVPALSLRARVLARIEKSRAYRSDNVLATLDGSPIADVRAVLVELEKEGVIVLGPGTNGKGYTLAKRARKSKPTIRLNWFHALELTRYFVSRRTAFEAGELRDAVDCKPAEASALIALLKECSVIMEAPKGFEVLEGFDSGQKIADAYTSWIAWLVEDHKGTPLTAEEWAAAVELPRGLMLAVASQAIKAKKIRNNAKTELVPPKKGKK